jgi:hypothetical protein
MYGSSRDYDFLPPQSTGDVQIFNSTGIANTQWQTWNKPPGTTMVYMWGVGGGGGGGGGFTRASGVAGCGGGGGGSSGAASALFFAHYLPDVLRVSVGAGGAGGAANLSGASGVSSYIASGVGLTAGTAIPNLILQSDSSPPGGGGGGGSSTVGSAGFPSNIATAASIGHWYFSSIFYKFQVGLTGTIGGSQTGTQPGAITTQFSLNSTGPGTGGGGVTTFPTEVSGGPISLTSTFEGPDFTFSPASSYVVGGLGGGGNGVNGITRFKPFFSFGGTGGGGANAVAGGEGGKGGIGSGGGGGGAGTTGGRGGNGGDGLVVIISW